MSKITMAVGTEQLADRLNRIVNGGELVKDAGTETVTLLLRLNMR
jgi:hypothetical protein